MAEAAGPPPKGGDRTRAPEIIGVYCAMTALSTACVGARLFTRFCLLRSPGKDDIVIGISWVILLGSLIFECYATKWGSGKHTYYLKPEEIVQAGKWNYAAAPWGIMGVSVPKLAIVLFLHRILGTAKRKSLVFLYLITIVGLVLSAIDVIMTFVQCNPPRASWNRSIPHICWSPNVLADFSFAVGGWSAMNDLVLAVFPATIIYGLQMSAKSKAALSLVLGLGVFSCICAIVRTTKLAAYKTSLDYTWTSAESILWSGAEINVIIICACIPTFLPLIQQVTGKKDYLSRRLPDPTITKSSSQRPLDDSLPPWQQKSSTTIKKTSSEGSRGADGSGEIRATTKMESQWEMV